ncbi:MAG TPA: RsmD family RNA methyltransferase [bacterium]|nr:RsmD family RNA methyltransferase [bacterium]
MGNLRITGGTLKGRRIEVPQGDFEIRPAMDRMRESVFSIMGPLDGESFLDLFSGSGIIALEAASRGADPVDCVERDRAKLGLLIRNVAIAPIRIACHGVPAERFILRCEGSFSVIFCDPPFPYAHKTELVMSIAQRGLLAQHGRLFIHYPGEETLPQTCGSLTAIDEREYGRSRVRIYAHMSGPVDSNDPVP